MRVLERRREGGKGEMRASMRGCWKRGGGEGIVGDARRLPVHDRVQSGWKEGKGKEES
jgi:hypothetical protein